MIAWGKQEEDAARNRQNVERDEVSTIVTPLGGVVPTKRRHLT